jgi:hypothetical protein
MRPACGDLTAHAAHWYRAYDQHCEGRTAEDAAAWEMVRAINAWVSEHYPYGRQLPPELRLELHPLAWHRLLQDTEMWRYSPDPDDWKKRFRVPAVVTPLLPEGTWRLVTVTEDVHLGGVMRPRSDVHLGGVMP